MKKLLLSLVLLSSSLSLVAFDEYVTMSDGRRITRRKMEEERRNLNGADWPCTKEGISLRRRCVQDYTDRYGKNPRGICESGKWGEPRCCTEDLDGFKFCTGYFTE